LTLDARVLDNRAMRTMNPLPRVLLAWLMLAALLLGALNWARSASPANFFFAANSLAAHAHNSLMRQGNLGFDYKDVSDAPVAAQGGMGFATTESVTVSGSRAIDLGKSYEAGVQGMYNGTPYKYSTLVNGQEVNGIADTVTSVAGKQTAVEAKFVEDWATSLRNPASPVGNTPWAISEQQAMVNQATKYSSYFDGGVIYHTNSTELAAYYSQVFKDAGITNFKFVITPAVK
jgi:hypothetical protein